MKFYVCLILTVTASCLQAQGQSGSINIPTPEVYYNFEYKNLTTLNDGSQTSAFWPEIYNYAQKMAVIIPGGFVERNNGNNGLGLRDSESGLGWVTDLNHGGFGKIVMINGMGTMIGSYLWGLKYSFNADNNPVTYHSVACWFYVNQQETITQKRMILFGGHDQEDVKPSIGLAHDNAHIYLIRYLENNPQRSYETNIMSPVDLNAGSGWYFISLVSTPFSTRVLLGKPNGEFVCSLHGLPSQDYSHIGAWGIGTMSSSYLPVRAVDDLMVWGQALSPDQVRALFLCSRDISPHPVCWGNINLHTARQAVSLIVEQPLVNEPETVEDNVTVYPNPSTTGNFTIDLKVSEDTPVLISIFTLQGVEIFSKQEPSLTRGSHRLQLNNVDTSCQCSGVSKGVYILKVKTNKLNESRRLIVQ